MSRFYGSLQGDKGEVTRSGHRSITAHPRGWETGIRVGGGDNVDGYGNRFDITVTGGSNGSRRSYDLGEVSEMDDGRLRFAVNVHGGTTVFYVDKDGGTATR